MNKRVAWLFLFLAVVPILVWLRAASAPAADALPAPRKLDAQSPAPADRFDWVGTPSCAAAACHGGDGPRGSSRSEYSTWIRHDLHARAYQVLFDKKSETIVEKLGLQPASREVRCLSCHVHPQYNEAAHTAIAIKADGVGCESCHGPARQWVGRHYLADWAGLSSAAKKELGWRDLRNLFGRAQVCVDCHVGAPGSDVNHDLIAAGHPRLYFEFGAFHANMPHHWNDARDKDPARGGRPDFEARAWAVGQVVSAQAALQQLARRAAEPMDRKIHPWPEFAEYNCYACHHDLQVPSYRQKPGHYEGQPGLLPWAEWYTYMLPRALAGAQGKTDAAITSALQDLKVQMEKPRPDRTHIATKATEVAKLLQPRLDDLRRQLAAPLPVPTLFSIIRKEDQRRAASNWDNAAQFYLALAAHYNALSDTGSMQSSPALKESLRGLAHQLKFQTGYDSPRSFDPEAVRRRINAITVSGKE